MMNATNLLRLITVLVIAPLLTCGAFSVASPGASASDLSVTPNWSEEGEQVAAEFGIAVASAGDVNGDGFDDVIVGADKYDNGVYREGAAFVYQGTANGLRSDPDWLASSLLSGARFGNSVSSAGDVNGDGFDDVLVGAYRYNNGQSEEGAAYAYYGSPSGLSTAPTWFVESNVSGAEFGYAVSKAGDVNADGYDDVLVGAPWYSSLQLNNGAVFLYLGSANGLNTNPAWIYESSQAREAFGSSVAGAGDVNGDGYADIVVGAPQFSSDGDNQGAAYIFLGSAVGLQPEPNRILKFDQLNASFGFSVASAGDVNQDGYSDVIIGAPNYQDGQDGEGAAFLYLGSENGLSPNPAWMAESNQAAAFFGISVSSAGDANKDGFDEIAVGAHRYDGDQPDEGAVFVYRGGPNGPSPSATWWAEGNKADTAFGIAVGSAGDVNDDGCADLIVGAPEYKRDERIVMGRAFVYHGIQQLEEPGYSLYLPVLRAMP